MQKIILALAVSATVGVVFFAGTQTKVSAATYSINRHIHTLPGGDCGQHNIQDCNKTWT